MVEPEEAVAGATTGGVLAVVGEEAAAMAVAVLVVEARGKVAWAGAG